MNKEKKAEIKVGITVLVSLILFILIYGWTKNISLNASETELELHFDNVAGLEIGDMVSVQGVRKGHVIEIISENGYAKVRVKFQEPVKLFTDSEFKIMMLDLMGGKKIEINPGKETQLLDFSKPHKGVFAGDISTAMATLHSVENDLLEMMFELKETLKNTNDYLSDNELKETLKHTAKNLQSLTSEFDSFLKNNKSDLTDAIKNTNELTNNVNELLKTNKTHVSSVIIKLDSSLTSANLLLNNLNQLSSDISKSKNNLGKLLRDEEILDDLKTSLNQIKKLTELLNEQLRGEGLKVKADVDIF